MSWLITAVHRPSNLFICLHNLCNWAEFVCREWTNVNVTIYKATFESGLPTPVTGEARELPLPKAKCSRTAPPPPHDQRWAYRRRRRFQPQARWQCLHTCYPLVVVALCHQCSQLLFCQALVTSSLCLQGGWSLGLSFSQHAYFNAGV